MGAIRLWGRRAAIRKEEQKLPISLFFIRRKWSDGRNSGRFLFWSFACALKILRILSAFQGIVLVGAPLSLLTSSASRVQGRGESSFSAPRRAGMRPKVTSLGNQRALFTAGGVNFDLKLTINVPCSQVNATDNANPRNWTNNMPRVGRSSNQHLLFSSL